MSFALRMTCEDLTLSTSNQPSAKRVGNRTELVVDIQTVDTITKAKHSVKDVPMRLVACLAGGFFHPDGIDNNDTSLNAMTMSELTALFKDCPPECNPLG